MVNNLIPSSVCARAGGERKQYTETICRTKNSNHCQNLVHVEAGSQKAQFRKPRIASVVGLLSLFVRSRRLRGESRRAAPRLRPRRSLHHFLIMVQFFRYTLEGQIRALDWGKTKTSQNSGDALFWPTLYAPSAVLRIGDNALAGGNAHEM
ncbi:hypothetical protein EVAR_100166_1 [Eumeta japonica]|uniref:Uncharacterized protein n=1 Tax=Eumeta variegata TaxID=151549 RepID=A0A4C1ZQL6_EUMVA|nr:hypothetical protein EVAR_100166_1 [Eumeta japonica]